MDLLVDNDTQGLHWTLKLSESRHLLAALFTDRKLFQTSVELLPAESSAMVYILEKLRDGGHYGKVKDADDAKGEDNDTTGRGKNMKDNGKNTKKNTATNRKDSESWLNGPLATESEPNMARFLNGIVDAVEKAMGGKFLNKQ